MTKGWITVSATLAIVSAVLVTALFGVTSSGRNRDSELSDPDDVPQIEYVRLNETVSNSSVKAVPEIDAKFKAYMTRWAMFGGALAIVRNDSLVYAKGYGKADEGVNMSPASVMRLASVSKLITAVAVMKAQEEGLLELRDSVFGPKGILCDALYTEAIGKKIAFQDITVEHLLRHQGGFYRDPMFGMQNLMQELGLSSPLTHDQTVRLGLRGNLRFAPGTWQRYSNFGYFLLADVLEKCSGMSYEEYVRTHVLEPAGIYDMHIGGNWYEDRRPGECRYYTHEGDGKYITDIRDTTRMTERSYGGNDVTLLSSAGGWTASVIELAKLVASIDGDETLPDILSQESVDAMVEYIDQDTYSLGWNDTNPEKGWSRTGTLSGTCALVRRYPDGECWIFVTNTSTFKGPSQAKLTEALFNQCRELYRSRLPEIDLFRN